MTDTKIRNALIKLKLIEMGRIQESKQIDDLFLPSTVSDEVNGDDKKNQIDVNKKLEDYENDYKKYLQTNPPKPNSATCTLQREIIDSFQKLCLATKKCESCGSYSPPIRKDGYTKLFEKPMPKKLKKAMESSKIKLKPALEKIRNVRESIDANDSDSEDEPIDNDDDSDDEGESKLTNTDKYLAAIEVEARIKLLWKHHSDYLNFIWHRVAISRPFVGSIHSSGDSELWRTFFIRAVLVPPSRFRPPADLGDIQSEHPQNLHLSKILTVNEKIDKLRTITTQSSDNNGNEGSSIDVSKLIGVWIDLQNAVNCFIDATKDQNVRPDESETGIRQILEKKEGLFRKHMMGKRVNYCCRSVISPDPFLGMNEIGIPVQFAKELHYPTPVTSWNVKMLRQMVENGPFVYPGIRIINY